MVGLVDDLERVGLAERRRGARDRRVQAIHLTAKGRRVLQRVTRLADEGNERTFGALDEDERVLLHDLLLRVAEATRPRLTAYSCMSAASAPTTFCSHARSLSSGGRRRSRRIAQLHSSWREPTATSGPTIA